MDEARPPQPAEGSAAARAVPNTAPVANIETAPRRNDWREMPLRKERSNGRPLFVVMCLDSGPLRTEKSGVAARVRSQCGVDRQSGSGCSQSGGTPNNRRHKHRDLAK